MMIGIFVRRLFHNIPHRRTFCTDAIGSLEFEYDLNKEIVDTHYNNVLILGINLPDHSNALNDSALISLNDHLKDFNESNKYHVAVLHGIGGNFCTGIQKSVNTENVEELIKTMTVLRKPTVACLTGYSILFGLQLAIMCDFRVMESNGVLGLRHKLERSKLHPLVCKKLVSLTSIGSALDVVLVGNCLDHKDCIALGLINRVADCGSGLGKALKFAACIGNAPLEEIISYRDMAYSFSQIGRRSE